MLDFLTGLETKDMEKVNSVWAEDAVQDMPYVPEGWAHQVIGKDNLIAQYAGWPDAAGEANFTDQLVFYPMADPQTVYVEFKGEVKITSTGRTYRQTYGSLFHVENGKITLYREYFDPRAFEYAFGLTD